MAIGYRAILTAEYTDDSLTSTLNVLRRWVTQKKRFSTLPGRGEVLSNDSGGILVADEVLVANRDVRGYRWTLTEEWAAPRWYKNSDTPRTGITQISLIISGNQLWLWVDIEPPTLEYVDSAGRERNEAQESGTPGFVSDILSEVELKDGLENPSDEIEVIASDRHLQHLIRILEDQTRRGSVYVTSPPAGSSLTGWKNQSEAILGKIEGMGFAYLLTEEARQVFNKLVEQGHRVPAGSIRTFLPGAELSDPKDALRHRLLHASTIRTSRSRRLQRIIRNAQIERLRNADLPDILREADYAFLRQSRLKPFEILHSTAPEENTESRTAELLLKLREAEELLEHAWDENYSLDKARSDSHTTVELLRMENEECYLDISALRSEVERQQRELEHLRRELARLGSEGEKAAYSYTDIHSPAERPATFGELIDFIPRLDGIRYFGDRNDAEDLDEYPDLGDVAVMKAWDALVTFHSYVVARREGKFKNSLSHYITHAQHGLHMKIAKVAWSEGKTVRTNPRMMAQRTVSGLPSSIDPSGSKLLVAHIALATGRAGSPRLYFEDTAAAADFVTIGYIGSHPENTQTN